MDEDLERKVIEIIEAVLRAGGAPVILAREDSMDTVPEWDSLTFMSVFTAINQAFELTPGFDDAIHYTSVSALCEFLAQSVQGNTID